ncbi:UDP-N-acetylmuramoyl-L-alanyl-D-glutamate--2,6-diaminopimelate ligase [Myxococcota bacterium]|nr:UDP-N-acetylmuramoyl-L-alanyl-D-glutamate--2,6-diaminopimelate ligase [Myxococcota bacterium]
MLLSELLRGVDVAHVHGRVDLPIVAVTQDSRRAGPGALFVALVGRRGDGHAHVPGLGEAAAVVVEQEVTAPPGVTVVRVKDSREALAKLAAAFFGHPSNELSVIGVTGTNGKTTTTQLIEAIAAANGVRAAVVGTVGNRIAGELLPATHTTPEPTEWQGLLRRAADARCAWAAAEVSSIGLDARRVDATRFAVGVYTNLTQDHLDYHGDMAAYAAAKARLFLELLPPGATALLNAEDPAVMALPALPEGVRRVTFGVEVGDVHAENLRLTVHGSEATVVTPWGDFTLRLPLLGRHNVANALGAAAAALSLGLSPEQVARGLAQAPPVPGRLEPVANNRGVTALVDYAHTEDGLRTVLSALRGLGAQRIVLVFGCGGDRDPQKRPRMAQAATEGADLVIATSDNPRGEDPLAILHAMEPGLRHDALLMPDRAEAIRRAAALARPGDVLLVAGKGHETTQEIAGVKHPFDDRLALRAALNEVGS